MYEYSTLHVNSAPYKYPLQVTTTVFEWFCYTSRPQFAGGGGSPPCSLRSAEPDATDPALPPPQPSPPRPQGGVILWRRMAGGFL